MPFLLERSGDGRVRPWGSGRGCRGAGGPSSASPAAHRHSRSVSSSSHGSMSRITAISCQPRRVLRAAYVDMDGTLLGRGASLFRDADGEFTMLGARTLEACARADVELVPYSGRRQSTLLHNAVLFGLRSYIFEAGWGWCWTARSSRSSTRSTTQPRMRVLLERYAGRLQMYDPWNRGRESSRLYLGAGHRRGGGRQAAHRGRGWGRSRLINNGLMHGADGGGRAYHLVPREASKARAVACAHAGARLRARGCHRGRRFDGGPRCGFRRRHVLARGERDARGPRRGAPGRNVRVAEAFERRRRLRSDHHGARRAALNFVAAISRALAPR